MTVDEDSFPPVTVHKLAEHVSTSIPEPYYHDYRHGVPIGIDLGSANTRAGLVNSDDPFLVFPTLISKYRERKVNRTLTYVGNDCFLDPSLRTSIKSPYDGPMITNWDHVEWICDYTFEHLSVTSSGGVDNPIVISEALAATLTHRSNMYQLLFEAYSVPKVATGIADLFSFKHNGGTTGLVIGAGNQSSNIIPVVDNKPLLTLAKRINWGGELATDYLSKSIGLKYPFFPVKFTHHQFETMVKDFGYFADNYERELENLMDLDYLVTKDVVVEAAFTEVVATQKSQEELDRQLEKRRVQGKRLQEQAQKARLEKLVEKEADFKYYSEIKQRVFGDSKATKKLQVATLSDMGFDDESDFNKYLYGLERSLKRARNQDIGENETDDVPELKHLDIKDEDLSEEQLKEKRHLKLVRANYDARMKAKEEKAIEKQKKAEEEVKETEWRERDLEGWIESKRTTLKYIVDRKKQRKKLKDELNDRKSHAAQIRMKNIANLASEGGVVDTSLMSLRANSKNGSSTLLNNINNAGRNKRTSKRVTIDNDPNDTFGANDDDWMIYRDISKADDEDALENEDIELSKLEEVLLKYDPNFSKEDVHNSEYNWRKSIVHKFLRGAYPFDQEDQHQQHQIHLNVERSKVPEILIQPNIIGLDEAGVVEISENLLLRRLPGEKFYDKSEDAIRNNQVSNDVFLTGGFSKLANFQNRIVKEFTEFLPVGTNLNVRLAPDPISDGWRGMKDWANSEDLKNNYISRKEYLEMGPDYIKEHNLGNVKLG